MELYDFILKKGSGKNTLLDREYNLIIKELFLIDDGEFFQEIKYRFTDGENQNLVILDIISRYSSDELTSLVYYLGKRVEEYAEEDFYKRFYK
jgi:hypothetical protein